LLILSQITIKKFAKLMEIILRNRGGNISSFSPLLGGDAKGDLQKGESFSPSFFKGGPGWIF
jgi:hypothetical protein